MRAEFPSNAANELIGSLLATQPGQFGDVARFANGQLSSPPNPLVLVKQLGIQSRRVYLYKSNINGQPTGSEISFPGVAEDFNDTDERFVTGFSAFGTPVVCGMVIKAPGHTNPATGASIGPSSILLETIVMEVNQERNIVTTPVSGRDGTVKEYISDGDYTIAVKGKIIGVGYLYPLVAVQNFLKVCRAKIAVDVESPYLREVFGITRMVIANYRLWTEEGVEGEQMFEFTALSESALETELANA